MAVQTCFFPAAALPARDITDFRDVSPGDWHYAYVKRLYENGLVNGVGENLYAPDNTVKTSEVAAMVIRYLGAEHSAIKNKASLTAGGVEGAELWYSGYIQSMCDMGIFESADIARCGLLITDTGAVRISDGAAAVIDAPARRMDVVKYIARSFELERGGGRSDGPLPRDISGNGHDLITGGGYDEAALETLGPLIGDYETIPASYRTYFLKCYYNGIIRGNEDGEVLPYDNMKRSELAKVIASVTYFDLRAADIRELPAACRLTPDDYTLSSVDGRPMLKKETAARILREQARYAEARDADSRVIVNVGRRNIIPAGFLSEAYIYKYEIGGSVYEVGRLNCASDEDPYFPKESSFAVTKSDSRGDYVGYVYFILRDLNRKGEIAGALMYNISPAGILSEAEVYYLP